VRSGAPEHRARPARHAPGVAEPHLGLPGLQRPGPALGWPDHFYNDFAESEPVIRAVLRAVFPDKTDERHNALRRALHETLQHYCETGKTMDADSAYIHDLFSTSTDGEQSSLIEEVRRQHYYEVIEFTKELSQRLCDSSDFSGLFQASKLKRILHEVDENAKQADIDKMYHIAFPGEEETAYYTDILRQLRHNILLRPERLWVKAEPKDVIEKMTQGPPRELPQLRCRTTDPRQSGVDPSKNSQGAVGLDNAASAKAGAGLEPSAAAPPSQPKRMKGAKVVDNPIVKMQSDLYSTPEGLQGAVLTAGIEKIAEEDDEVED